MGLVSESPTSLEGFWCCLVEIVETRNNVRKYLKITNIWNYLITYLGVIVNEVRVLWGGLGIFVMFNAYLLRNFL